MGPNCKVKISFFLKLHVICEMSQIDFKTSNCKYGLQSLHRKIAINLSQAHTFVTKGSQDGYCKITANFENFMGNFSSLMMMIL